MIAETGYKKEYMLPELLIDLNELSFTWFFWVYIASFFVERPNVIYLPITSELPGISCFLESWAWFFVAYKTFIFGLPWWRSGWESACQCRGHGFKPWSGKIPHATEQLGPWATVTEPARLEPVLRNKRGRDGERPVHRDEEWSPLATTRESPHTETKTQHSHK